MTWWALLVAASVQAESGTCRAEVDWHPERTWVFAVGVLKWEDPETWRGMANAEPNRRDVELVQHFRKAGVADDHIVYLQDHQATRQKIQHEMTTLLGRARPNDVFIFYFTGHGFRDRKSQQVHFANYDATDGKNAWLVHSIYDTIEAHFQGSHVLLMADCCYSGALADEARGRKTRLGYACLCSSFSHNSSTGHWTFTDCLLAGLRGQSSVDLNGDGEIAVSEVGQYSELEMAFVERQKSVYDVNREFPLNWRMAKPIRPRGTREGDRIEVEWDGKWYRAQIQETQGDRCRVHYVGYGSNWDEWVGPQRMRAFQPKRLDQGRAIEVRWSRDQKWYPAKVLRSWYGLTLIHYEGFSNEWDEWVNFDSIRFPGKTAP
jgi:hypothetical protein